MIKTAVIIAGGEGSRLRPLTDNKPKAMAELNGKPMIYWVINWLKSNGIKNIVVGVAYKKERIIGYLKKNKDFGLNINISEHTLEGGTAQGFKLAISRHVKDENFLGMNCDEITNLNFANFVKVHESKNPLVTMALAPFHCKFSVVTFDKDGTIYGFKYGHKLEDVPISIGVYIFNSKIIDYLPDTGSIEDLVFAKLAPQKKMAAYMILGKEEWVSVNSLKDVKDAEEKLTEWKRT